MKTAANTQFCGSQKNGRQKSVSIRINILLNFLDWLGSPGASKFLTPIEDMNMEDLNACLKSFYTSATKQDGSFYKKTSLKSIRATIDCFLCSSPRSKQFSITSHTAFSKQQIQKLFYCGEPGLADTKNPAQLQRTTWFYLGLFSGRRGQEKQREIKSGMLTLFGIFNFLPKLTILHGP